MSSSQLVVKKKKKNDPHSDFKIDKIDQKEFNSTLGELHTLHLGNCII